MAKFSRRVLVSSAATLPTLALPVPGLVCSSQRMFDDTTDDPVITLAGHAIEARQGFNAMIPQGGMGKMEFWNWELQHQDAGYYKACEAQERAAEKTIEATEALRGVRPKTIRGLVAKAQAARLVKDRTLYLSLAWDLGVMAGGVETGQASSAIKQSADLI